MAKEFKYQLREDLSLEHVKNFIGHLYNRSHLVHKGYLELGYPDILQDNFIVTYEKEKYNNLGNINPSVFLNILIALSERLRGAIKEENSGVFLPVDKNSPEYIIFYKDYSIAGTAEITSKVYQEDFIEVLYKVANGLLKKKAEETGSDNKAGDISELSLSFRQGNLIDNWSKDRGVLAFANHLLSIKKLGDKTPLIGGELFGRHKDEFYFFGNALGALSEYHREFKEDVTSHVNFKHPEGSQERKNLDKLIEKNYPFFSGRGIVILDSNLEGKLSTDDSYLREFIELFDNALKALGKKVPKKPTGGEDEDDIDGGSDKEEPKEKRDQKDLITFDELYKLIRDKLISFIYETYYKDSVEQESLKLVRPKTQYETRLLLLGIISFRIDSIISLRTLLRNELNSNWISHVEEEDIHNSEDLATDIESFVEFIANNQFDFATVINEDILKAQNSLSGIESLKSDEKLTKIDFPSTANIIVRKLKDEKIFADDFSGDDWKKLSSKDRVSYWKRLSLSERRAFLEKHHLMDYVNQYSTDISIKYLEEQLAKNSISLSERIKFARLLNEMSSQIAEDLISIPPTEFGDDTEIFLAKLEEQSFFLRMEQHWITEFTPSLEREIADFALHNPQFITHEFIQDKSFNEIASELNQNLTGNAGEDKINEAAELILDQILNNLRLPRGVKLEGLDRNRSVREIEVYLRLYLKKNNIDYIYFLYTDTDLTRFVNKYSNKLLGEKSAFFLPLVEERINLIHRQIIFEKIQQQFGIGTNAQDKINFENTLYSILTEAALSKVNPEDYIDKLTQEDLNDLFGLTKAGITLSQEDYELLRELILQYVKARREGLHFKNPQEVDKEEFTDGTLFLREQSRGLRKQGGGGRIIYTAITYEPPSIEEEQALIEVETELETLVREDHIRQRVMALAIWEAYSEEERILLANHEAQNLAIYQQQQILDQHAVEDKEEKKKKGLLKKGIDKLKDKGINTGATAATAALSSAIIPGAGIAIAGFINALPISDKYKKYLSVGMVGGLVGLIGGGAYLFTHTIGGFFGGILGGIGGFFVAGPAGVFGGWLVGSYVGYGVEIGIKSFFGDVGNWISNTASNFGNWVGNGLHNIFGGGSSSVAQVGASIPQAGIGPAHGVTAGSGTSFGLTQGGLTSSYVATVAVVTATVIVTGGGIFVTNALHTAFLQRVPEVSPDVGDTSQYVMVEKKALEGNEFDNPQEITYSISITPKSGYEIQINPTPSDDFSFNCNEETRSDCPNNTNTPEFEDYRNFVSRLIEISGLVIASGETLEVGTYTVPFNENYTDASIKNTFEINFTVVSEGEIISSDESARISESICFGECPALKEGCWPTNGKITQAPYAQTFSDGSPGTHSVIDAIDIVNTDSPNIYSTTPGKACFFSTGSGAGAVYGEHVLVKNGAFALLYGHFASLAEDPGTCVSIKAGTLLGRMGTTGGSTTIHLHWEMRRLGGGFGGYTSQIPGQSYRMSGQTLLEQHTPIQNKIKDILSSPDSSQKFIETCYE